MKICGHFQAFILTVSTLAIPTNSYRESETRLGDVMVGDHEIQRKGIQQDPVSAEEQELIVRMHDNYRAQVQSSNMMKLRYHAGIAQKAQALADTCGFAHDKTENRSLAELPGVYIGQNLCMGHSSWAACIDNWADEKNNFAYGIGSTNGRVIGHYTQMMLWKTMAIGCGFNTCGGNRFYVCNYAYGQYTNDLKAPWMFGNQCGECPNTCTVDGFCDCGGIFCKSAYEVMAPTCQCMNWWAL